MKPNNNTAFKISRILEILSRTPEAKTPVFSCFVNLEAGKEAARKLAETNFLDFRNILPDAFQHHADEALAEFELILSTDVSAQSKGFAFYFRTGSAPFCHWTQTSVPLRNSFIVGHNPVILPLLELQDKYDRYFVLISTHDKARILEIHLGEAIHDKRLTSSAVPVPDSKTVTYRHYQNNMPDRGDTFFDEKVEIITRLLTGVHQRRLILAGYSDNIKKLREKLPAHLQNQVLDELPLSDQNDSEQIVLATLQKRVNQELIESKSKLKQFHDEHERDGLAVLGCERTREALLSGMVDTLLVTQTARPNAPIWKAYLHDWQSESDLESIHALFEKEKEDILRIALESGVMIEFVEPDWLLDAHEGVGALLRYQSTPKQQSVSLSDFDFEKLKAI